MRSLKAGLEKKKARGPEMNLFQTISSLSEEKQKALERILNHGKGNFSIKEIIELINAYEVYDKKIQLASRETHHSLRNCSRIWQLAGFKTRGKGAPLGTKRKSIMLKQKYEDYKNLIKEGLNQSQIAERLDITRQGVYYFLGAHPELRKLYWEIRRNKK